MTGMQVGTKPTLVAIVTLILVCAIACSQGFVDEQAREIVAGGGDAPTIRLSAISPTEASVLDGVSILVEPGEGGYDVAVKATDDLAAYGDLFLRVEYDPAAQRIHGLRNSIAELRPDVIGLAMETEPGVVEFGAVKVKLAPANGEQAAASSGVAALGDQLLSFKLLPGASDRQVSSVAASNRARARNLALVELEDGSWELSWDYTNPGDNNQDGVVGIQDLTPIGRNYLAQVSNSWSDPLRHLDSNGDGEINLPDITSIGQNYSAEIFAYQIEMSEDGENSFITVGQLLMGDQTIEAGKTYRFYYTFGAQYVAAAWYRVVPLDKDLGFGLPSEAINEEGRRMDHIVVPSGDTITITVTANGLEHSIAHLNSVRVIYPNSYNYAEDSFNVGSPGGNRDYVDGIWASFAQGLLLPPEALLIEYDLSDSRTAMDFNVTKIAGSLPSAPVNHGDLFNFRLRSSSGDPLTLEFQEVSEDGIKRTYYAGSDTSEHFFGNTIGLRVQ